MGKKGNNKTAANAFIYGHFGVLIQQRTNLC